MASSSSSSSSVLGRRTHPTMMSATPPVSAREARAARAAERAARAPERAREEEARARARAAAREEAAAAARLETWDSGASFSNNFHHDIGPTLVIPSKIMGKTTISVQQSLNLSIEARRCATTARLNANNARDLAAGTDPSSELTSKAIALEKMATEVESYATLAESYATQAHEELEKARVSQVAQDVTKQNYHLSNALAIQNHITYLAKNAIDLMKITQPDPAPQLLSVASRINGLCEDHTRHLEREKDIFVEETEDMYRKITRINGAGKLILSPQTYDVVMIAECDLCTEEINARAIGIVLPCGHFCHLNCYFKFIHAGPVKNTNGFLQMVDQGGEVLEDTLPQRSIELYSEEDSTFDPDLRMNKCPLPHNEMEHSTLGSYEILLGPQVRSGVNKEHPYKQNLPLCPMSRLVNERQERLMRGDELNQTHRELFLLKFEELLNEYKPEFPDDRKRVARRNFLKVLELDNDKYELSAINARKPFDDMVREVEPCLVVDRPPTWWQLLRETTGVVSGAVSSLTPSCVISGGRYKKHTMRKRKKRSIHRRKKLTRQRRKVHTRRK
jgi:hypothetical protein